MPALSKLTADRHRLICEGLLLGMTYKLVAAYADIAESTLHDWRARGRSDQQAGVDSLYARLVKDIRASEARSAASALRVVNEVARGIPPAKVKTPEGELVDAVGSPRDRFYAAAWLLERRHGYVAMQDLRIRDGEGEEEEWLDDLLDDPEVAEALERAANRQATLEVQSSGDSGSALATGTPDLPALPTPGDSDRA